MKDFTYGSYTFEEVGPGFVSFRIETKENLFQSFLEELKLIVVKKQQRWRRSYEWTDEFKQFLIDHNYGSPVSVIKKMKTDGLVLSTAQALVFRLKFL